MSPVLFVSGGSVLLAIIWLVWRFESTRKSLPCPVWLRWLVEMDNPFTETNRAHVIVSLLRLQPGMRVLDAGCGPGRLTLPCARVVGPQGQVTALDLQEGMLRRTQEKVSEAGLENVLFLQAGLGQGRLPVNTYDRALLVTVLGEIPDQDAALAEIYASLKPGGTLSVTEIIFDPHFQPRASVCQVAGRAGFRETGFFGKPLAYTLHLEKPIPG